MESTHTQEVHNILRNISVKLSTKPSQESSVSKGDTKDETQTKTVGKRDILEERRSKPFKTEIVWFNAIGFLILHIGMVYGIYRAIFYAKWMTSIWGKYFIHLHYFIF